MERITATASKITEGVPASWPWAGSIEPSASLAPPTFGATIFTDAPASVAAFPDPLDCRAVGAVRHQDTDGAPHERLLCFTDDPERRRRRHIDKGRREGRGMGYSFHSQARGNPLRQVLVYMPEMTDHRVAHVGVPTLESSKTSAEAMWACS